MDGRELDIDGLRRRYGTVTALDDPTFAIPAGEVFGFLGPNGAGKTTTMRAIFGVTALDARQIAVRIYTSSILKTGSRISFRQALRDSRKGAPSAS